MDGSTPPIGPVALDHLVVPLDGSRLAEAALTPAIELASRLPARITLLHVLERNAPATVHGDRHLTTVGAAEAYLRGAASRFADVGVPAAIHVHSPPEGDIGEAIADHAAELAADLIVLCAHGQGGLRGWLTGAMAQQVIRRAAPPVLLVRSHGQAAADRFRPRLVLVALDTTPAAEAALPPAVAVARAFGADVELVAVVATRETVTGDREATAVLVPTATAAALDAEAATADAYLRRLAGRLPAALPVRTTVLRGDLAGSLLAAARPAHALLALATHGRGGLDALWAASVGARVVARATAPLLLVHPGASASAPDEPAGGAFSAAGASSRS